MKLSDRARKNGIDYRTAYRLYRSGRFPGPTGQLATGTKLVHEPEPGHAPAERVVLYARVSSADRKSGTGRQMKRLEDYAAARGSHAGAEISEIGSGLNRLKKGSLSWMYEISKCAPQETLRDLDSAFTRFFDGNADFPKFKSKKHGCGSFRLTGAMKAQGYSIQLPCIGTMSLKENGCLPADGHIPSTTVSERGGRWFVSLAVIEEHTVPENSGSICGVDLGVKNLATVSDGTVFENPRSLSTYIRKLKRQQREVSRKVKRSNSRRKAVHRLNRTHLKISDMRMDAIHKATTWLAKNKSAIVIEDLNAGGMMCNHRLAAAISDASFGEFRRQLEYKAGWYGSRIVVADRFYPSSRTCSACGHVKQELKLSERVFECEMCNSRIDRDLNAAINLSGLAASSAESLNACLRREVTEPCAQCPPVIQEMNTTSNGISG